MNKTNDGGPAFPVSIPGCGDNGASGMTLRDYFAAKIMQGFASDPTLDWTASGTATVAYKWADAMLEARTK